MAEITRPQSPPAPDDPDKLRVNGYAVTPAEGVDSDEVPKVPLQPNDVLELLRARLALDEGANKALLAGAVSHEATLEPARSSPPRGKVPSCSDITPSPVVIGIDEIEALSSAPETDATATELLEHWREPAAKDTPAEPVASVRVRQASFPENPTSQATASSSDSDNEHEPPELSNRASLNERLYFPPMKPPESWQYNGADEPLVKVVPDCDAKTRTARSLRRPSSRPAPVSRFEVRGQHWLLGIGGGGLAIALVIAVVSGPQKASGPLAVPDKSQHAVSVDGLLSPSISASFASNPPPASSWDGGINSLGTDMRAPTLKPVASATTQSTVPPPLGRASSKKELKAKGNPPQPKTASPTATVGDDLVF